MKMNLVTFIIGHIETSLLLSLQFSYNWFNLALNANDRSEIMLETNSRTNTGRGELMFRRDRRVTKRNIVGAACLPLRDL